MSQLRNVIKFIFLPALLLSFLLSCSSILFHLSEKVLVGQLAQDPASNILPRAIFALVLLVFAIYKPFEKVFRGTLIALTGVITLLTGLMFFQATPWSTSVLYTVLGLANFSVYALFIWGFINRLVSSAEGIKYYIPVAFVLGIAGAVISHFGLIVVGPSRWPLMAMMIPAIAFMILSLLIFNWSWRRIPESLIEPKEESSVSQNRFPFLSAAYVLAAGVMVKSFLDILFKAPLRAQFPDPASFSTVMSNYTMLVGASTLVFSIIWAVLGTWLIVKKGWKTTVLYTSLSILVGGILFLSLPSSWLHQGIFTGLLTSATNTLFFPLIQIVYLYLPCQNRFRTKIVTEMIALPLMKGAPLLATQGLLVTFGSIAAITPYLKILVLLLLLLLLIASKRAGPRFSEPNTKSLQTVR